MTLKDIIVIVVIIFLTLTNVSVIEELTSSRYSTNVFPSLQCANKSISDFRMKRLISKTGSMRPYIYGNDILLTVEYDPNVPLVLGDVVGASNRLHRIVSISTKQGYFRMKGDNNNVIDSKNIFLIETDLRSLSVFK